MEMVFLPERNTQLRGLSPRSSHAPIAGSSTQQAIPGYPSKDVQISACRSRSLRPDSQSTQYSQDFRLQDSQHEEIRGNHDSLRHLLQWSANDLLSVIHYCHVLCAFLWLEIPSRNRPINDMGSVSHCYHTSIL